MAVGFVRKFGKSNVSRLLAYRSPLSLISFTVSRRMQPQSRGPSHDVILPPRWLNCPPMGGPVVDIFIPFKTPLNSKFDHLLPVQSQFHVADVFSRLSFYNISLWIDLTKSRRFYTRKDLSIQPGCKYIKLECLGNEGPPTTDQVSSFISFVNQYLNSDLGKESKVARPPGIYKADYLEELFKRYGSEDDEHPVAPSLPDWCHESDFEDLDDPDSTAPATKRTRSSSTNSTNHPDASLGDTLTTVGDNLTCYPPPPNGTPVLMESVPGVTILNQASQEAHDCRSLADRLLAQGGVVLQQDNKYQPAQPSPVSSSHPLRFRASQPVSMTMRSVDLLASHEYCATHKADGVRYLLLISRPDHIYLIDRANFIYKVDCLHFPTTSWVGQRVKTQPSSTAPLAFITDPNGHLIDTLLDAEMVLCQSAAGQQTARLLIYDAVALNGHAVGRRCFGERYSLIDKEVIWPRNTGGHHQLVDFGRQSFSVRRKPFLPLKEVIPLLKSDAPVRLEYETDGLIFQPCGPSDLYVLGTCPQTLKWKPPRLNTIDFRCRIVYENKVGEIPHYVGNLYLGGLNVPSAKLAHVTPKDKSLDGRIVECFIEPGVGWKVMRVRTDKTEPNYHTSGVSIIESIICPVTSEIIVDRVAQRGARLRQAQREEAEKAAAATKKAVVASSSLPSSKQPASARMSSNDSGSGNPGSANSNVASNRV